MVQNLRVNSGGDVPLIVGGIYPPIPLSVGTPGYKVIHEKFVLVLIYSSHDYDPLGLLVMTEF